MPDLDEPPTWDFFTIVDIWNRDAFPFVLMVVAGVVLLRRRHDAGNTGPLSMARLAVYRIGLIHYLLSLSFLIAVAQALFSGAWAGPLILVIVAVHAPVLSIVVNGLLGFGLCRLSRGAQLAAIVWNGLCSVVGIASAAWMIYYRASIDPARWPDLFVAKLLPFVLFVLLLLPPVKRVFVPTAPDDSEADRGSVLSLTALLALLILVSTITIDVTDWVVRVVFPSELEP